MTFSMTDEFVNDGCRFGKRCFGGRRFGGRMKFCMMDDVVTKMIT